jgi:phosphatidylinositol alpha-1,6-mannosyltransferase
VKRVLVLAPPLGSVGGVQRYTATLVHALKDTLGVERVRLLAVPSEPEPQADGGIAIRPAIKLKFLAASIVAAIRWRPDLIICAHVGVAPIGWILKMVFGTRYWLVLYGIEVWGDLPFLKRRALRNANRLVSISRFTLETVKLRNALKNPDAAILPPALTDGTPQPERTPRSARPNMTRPTVLTVGRLAASERYKGHDVVLDAWPQVIKRKPEALYLIVGDGDDRPRLEARVKEMGLSDSVHFAGSVTAAELHDCYDGCRVFAMPTRTEIDAPTPRGEGFGIVFLEAMIHGRPVVGPRDGAPAEFIRSGQHGLLVNPTDPHEIARALIELLEDEELGNRMGTSGRAWVAENFSYETFCRRLRELLLANSVNCEM